ncbi:MAG TPA: hypothetical protein VHC69_29895 [Polyangiaceae bacterium]|nr:hypothetical protein [Polyangiaceae bacterium]
MISDTVGSPAAGLAPRDLPVVTAPVRRPRRWAVAGAGLLATAMFASTYFMQWWSFILYAPQYPAGLRLTVSLTGVSGDVDEVDRLNHYIGMASLTHAAPTERALAGYGVAIVAAASLVLLLGAGRRLRWLAVAVGAAFPALFIADSSYWLYRFGHHLNAHAPLRLSPFTPEMFGNGTIGQFMTFAKPEVGFWVACAATALLAGAVRLRWSEDPVR